MKNNEIEEKWTWIDMALLCIKLIKGIPSSTKLFRETLQSDPVKLNVESIKKLAYSSSIHHHFFGHFTTLKAVHQFH